MRNVIYELQQNNYKGIIENYNLKYAEAQSKDYLDRSRLLLFYLYSLMKEEKISDFKKVYQFYKREELQNYLSQFEESLFIEAHEFSKE